VNELTSLLSSVFESCGYVVGISLFVVCAVTFASALGRARSLGRPLSQCAIPGGLGKLKALDASLEAALTDYVDNPSERSGQSLLEACRGQTSPVALFLSQTRPLLGDGMRSKGARRLLNWAVDLAGRRAASGVRLPAAMARIALALGVLAAVSGLTRSAEAMLARGLADRDAWASGLPQAVYGAEAAAMVALLGFLVTAGLLERLRQVETDLCWCRAQLLRTLGGPTEATR